MRWEVNLAAERHILKRLYPRFLAPYAQAKIDRLAADFDSKLYVMEQRTITQAEYEAMEKELEKELEAKDVLEVKQALPCDNRFFFAPSAMALRV